MGRCRLGGGSFFGDFRFFEDRAGGGFASSHFMRVMSFDTV